MHFGTVLSSLHSQGSTADVLRASGASKAIEAFAYVAHYGTKDRL